MSYCPNVEKLEEIHRGLRNSTTAQSLAEMLNALITELELNYTMHERAVKRIAALETTELASIAATEADLDQRITQLRADVSLLEQRHDDLEADLALPRLWPPAPPGGPLPAITDPEVFIRELFARIQTLPGAELPLGDASGRTVSSTDVVARGHVLNAIRDLIEKRGIDPRLILDPNQSRTPEEHREWFFGGPIARRRCGAYFEGQSANERCVFVAGHPGEHVFTRISP